MLKKYVGLPWRQPADRLAESALWMVLKFLSCHSGSWARIEAQGRAAAR